MKEYFDRKNGIFLKHKQYKQTSDYKEKRKDRKFNKVENVDNNDYGIYADEDDEERVKEIWEKCIDYYEKRVVADVTDASFIEKNTQEQASSQNWYYYRMKRLTASRFGDICRALVDNSKINIVKQLVYQQEKKNVPKAIQYGLDNESVAIDLYSQTENKKINKSGLRISSIYPFLGCSPDGLIFDSSSMDIDSVIEVKCPYAYQDFSLEDIKQSKEFYMKYDQENETFSLKKTHQYYYQVQGILNILGLPYCEFVVYTPKNKLIVERIESNLAFWNSNMLPKLKNFYFRFYLPELVLTRFEQGRNLFVFSEDFYQSTIIPYIEKIGQ